MNHCYLSLGSNLKMPERQLRLAIKKLQFTPSIQIKQVARFYRNKAVGRRSQPEFCNTVIEIYTRLSPLNLLRQCQAIEQAQARVRRIKWGARTLDIDIITYNTLKIAQHNLIIPHPLMASRDFVTIPLNELLKATVKSKNIANKS